MAEFLVKCPVCTNVADATLETCPSCGAALPAIPKKAQPHQPTSYAEKYREEAQPDAVIIGGARAPDRSWTVIAVAAGIVLILAVGAASAYFLGGGAPKPTPARMVYGPAATPAPTPSPVATIVGLVTQLNDPGFAVHMVVSTTYTADAKIMPNGKGVVVHAGLDVQISNGDESGMLTIRGGTTEFRLVGGTYYQRSGGKWLTRSPLATIPMRPLFDITTAGVLSVVGEENLDGASVVHLQTTKLWNPDLHRISLIETFNAQPQNVVLDLWTTADGTPVRATLHVGVDAASGAHLMSVETRCDFTDAGIPVEILPPK